MLNSGGQRAAEGAYGREYHWICQIIRSCLLDVDKSYSPSDTRIGVLKPRSADLGILFVYLQFHEITELQFMVYLVGKCQTRVTSADADYF